MLNDPLDFLTGSLDNILFAHGEYMSVFKFFYILLQDIPTMFDETTFQTCVRAVRELVLIKTGKDIGEELQSVFKLDETLNNLGKLAKEGNGTGGVVEMISEIASTIISGYITRLAEATYLQSQSEQMDQPSKELPTEIQPVINRLKLFIKRTYHAKEEVDNIMKVIDNMVRFQITIMRMMHSSLKESGVYIIYSRYIQ